MERRKRSYTVPVLLLIITAMAAPLILLYSKQLISEQTQATEEGKRLADRYAHTLLFADRVLHASDLMLKDASAADRLKAKEQLGEARIASGPASVILSEAVSRSSGQPMKEATPSNVLAMNTLFSEPNGKLLGIAEHDGPLTEQEKSVLLIVRDGAAKMQKALEGFRPPALDAGFRRMQAGENWIGPALAAGQALKDMAAKLK